MSAIAWTTIQPAIQAWIASAAGVAADHVFFVDLGGPQPTRPYVAARITDVAGAGQDWRIYADAPAPVTPGQELVVKAQGPRTARLDLQYFAAPPDPALGGGGPSPLAALTDVVTSIPLNAYTLDQAGIGIGTPGPVQLIEGKRGSILEPRAVVSIPLHLAAELQSFDTYIQYVQVTATAQKPDGTALDTVTEWTPSAPP